MGRNVFDRKFGAEFIGGVPLCAGVYEILDTEGRVIYVGKAKNLRRRLQQYRNARRCKRHHKMRAILKAAAALRYTTCANDLEALLLENQNIQTQRPKFNVAGAFSFLYPVIGLRREGTTLAVVYTTTPGEYRAQFQLYGAFRSRLIVHEAFESLAELLGMVGHPEPSRNLRAYPRVRFSRVSAFRMIADRWIPLLQAFLRGESDTFLEEAVLELVERPSARRHAAEVQEHFDRLWRFYRLEAHALRKAMKKVGLGDAQAITQEERDRLFLRSRHSAGSLTVAGAKLDGVSQ